MGLFSQLRGIIGSLFQIGGTGGPNIQNNGGEVDIRNAANSAFAGLASSYLAFDIAANVSTVGLIRTNFSGSQVLIGGLNNAKTASLDIMSVDASNDVWIGVSTIFTNPVGTINLYAGGGLNLGSGTSVTGIQLGATATGIFFSGGNGGLEVSNTASAPSTPSSGGSIFYSIGGNPAVIDGAGRKTLLTQVVQVLNASFTTTSVTPLPTNLGVAIEANEVMVIRWQLTLECSGVGGVELEFTGPAGAVTIDGWWLGYTSTAAQLVPQHVTAYSALTGAFNTTGGSTPLPVTGVLTVVNGATAGTIQVNVKSVTAGQTSTVLKGSSVNAELGVLV